MWNLLSMRQKLAFGQETVLQPLRPALRVDQSCRKNGFKEAGLRNISYLSKGKIHLHDLRVMVFLFPALVLLSFPVHTVSTYIQQQTLGNKKVTEAISQGYKAFLE